MARRKKSLEDIGEQRRRIYSLGNQLAIERDGSSGYGNRGAEYYRQSPRMQKAMNISAQYARNIFDYTKAKGGVKSNEKFSQRVYRGLASTNG